MEIKNGEKPAFAAVCYGNDDNSGFLLEGLTKREYFAAMAMQGIASNRQLAKRYTVSMMDEYFDMVAQDAREMADKLLLELSKQNEDEI
jgi:hypothetical protein